MALSNESEISSKNFFDIVAIFGGLYTKSINHFFIETVNSKKLVSDTFVSRLLSVFTISTFFEEKLFSLHPYYVYHVEMVKNGISPSQGTSS